ncbi:MAG TPA: hypothetical protein VF832_18935 [Longimicrobiales bacterium]
MTLPDAASLAVWPLHVVVRDFPETLAVFRRAGLDVSARGGESFSAAAGAEADTLHDALRLATAWRTTARPGPCERAAALAAAHRSDAAREAGLAK